MSQPRVAGIVSGIAASIAAFLVVSRWHLAGTLTGAAIMPVIYTLVSHGSLESLESVGRWTRRRLGYEKSVGGVSASSHSTRVDPIATEMVEKAGIGSTEPGRQGDSRGRGRGGFKVQWVLAGVSTIALAVSVFSFLLQGQPDQTVIRERVVERTVTVTTQVTRSVEPGTGAGAADTTTSVTTEQADTSSTGDTPSTTVGTGNGQDGSGTTTSTESPGSSAPSDLSSTTTTGNSD